MALAATAQAPEESLFHIGPIENWVHRSELPPGLLRQAHDAPLYFIHLSYQDRVATDKIDRYVRRVYQVNDASQIEDQAQSLHDIWPESESITFHTCAIYRAGKTIDCLDPNRIRAVQRETGLENHCVSDRLTLELLIDDLRVGDVVDIEATQTEYAGSHLLHGKFYLSTARLVWGVPVKDMTLRYVNQTDNGITLQHLDSDKNINDVWEVSAGDEYMHHVTDLESERSIDALPYWYWSDYLLATTNNTWQNVSSYIYEQNLSQNVLDNAIDETLLDEIEGIDWQQCNKANITAIVRFVQEHIRYRAESNGIHTHTPKPVAETLRRRTGDCKDKSALLVVLLRKIGVAANLALVNTSMMDDVKTLQASAYWFNHMIVHFNFNNRSYVIDPTLQKQGGDIDTQARLSFGLCLPLTQEGSDLIEVEAVTDPLLYIENVDIDLCHDTLNACTVRIERTYFQERADNMRFQIASREHAFFEEHFLQVAQDSLNLELIIVEAYRIESDNKQKNCLQTVELYQIQGDIESHPDKTLRFCSDLHNDYLMPKRNSHPVATAETGRARNVVRVHYGTSPASVNETFKEENEWFEYSDTLKNREASIVCETEFLSKTNSIDAKDVAGCRDAVAKVQERSVTQLPLKLNLEVETKAADHQWYLYPCAYWLLLQGTKIMGLWGNPMVMAVLAALPVAFIGFFIQHKWFSSGK